MSGESGVISSSVFCMQNKSNIQNPGFQSGILACLLYTSLSFISALKANSESEYVAYIGLDTDFPVNDQYAVNNDRYDFIGQWYRVIWIAVPVCIIGILFCFIYLILAAGYKEGVEGIYLSRFDRIYTEDVYKRQALYGKSF